eukprot:5208355-Prymnesium_polylepis.2
MPPVRALYRVASGKRLWRALRALGWIRVGGLKHNQPADRDTQHNLHLPGVNLNRPSRRCGALPGHWRRILQPSP